MERAAWPADTAAALRSQLNQMAAASQVLEHSTGDEKGRTYLAILNQSICRMLRIVNRMELEDRLSGGASALSLQYTDLSPLLEDLNARLSGILADIKISFVLHCPDHLYAAVDGELLRQMLLELVSLLALACTRLTLTVSTREGRLCFTLSDSGPGPADGRSALPAALESQEEQSSLALARRIAELHGGVLMLSPTGDQSLSVTVSIPHSRRKELQLNSAGTSWRSGGFDSVLVALSQLLPARSYLPENLG